VSWSRMSPSSNVSRTAPSKFPALPLCTAPDHRLPATGGRFSRYEPATCSAAMVSCVKTRLVRDSWTGRGPELARRRILFLLARTLRSVVRPARGRLADDPWDPRTASKWFPALFSGRAAGSRRPPRCRFGGFWPAPNAVAAETVASTLIVRRQPLWTGGNHTLRRSAPGPGAELPRSPAPVPTRAPPPPGLVKRARAGQARFRGPGQPLIIGAKGFFPPVGLLVQRVWGRNL